jgi:hypothetical protein
MKKPFLRLCNALVALGLMAGVATAQDWGEYAYDEQQWWNPGDWFDDRTNTWDYHYDWTDNDWSEDIGNVGGADDPDDYGSGYGADQDDWYDDFDYDFEDNYIGGEYEFDE